jgi:hypothetical protein
LVEPPVRLSDRHGERDVRPADVHRARRIDRSGQGPLPDPREGGEPVTHTYAILDVSPTTYAEIRALLERAGYQHAFDEVDGQQVIDLHGIALRIHAHEPVDG